ncbi:MAG: BamA/TamA family outer membrane protein, partial [Chitinivibrionales bacterium]|nr:BamA/TamA family outer membrane protein [Chitinivibrionales bacterium]
VTVQNRHTTSGKIFFSWADQSLPPVEQIYLGGILPEEKHPDIGVYNRVPFIGLRGRSISGDIVAFIEGTYRFAITKKLYLNLLMDWGYAWHQKSNGQSPLFAFDRKTVLYFIHHAPVGAGASVAYQSIIGPVVLSWGRIVHGSLQKDFNIAPKNNLYFSVGHDF